MNVIARELMRAAGEVAVRAVITVPRKDGVEAHAFNSVHYEVQRFLDRVRRNEGMETVMARLDSMDEMQMQVGFTDHDQGEAITRELVALTSKVCARNGIETIRVAFSGSEADSRAAADLMDVAGLLASPEDPGTPVMAALREMGAIPAGPVAGPIRWQAVFFMGPSGSGKSYVREKRYLKHLDFKMVDPDEIKKLHPDYDPDAPFGVHQWSKAVADAEFKKLVTNGTGVPVIMDGTGQEAAPVIKKMKLAERNGYRTYLIYVWVPFEISVFRNRNRDRFVEEKALMTQSKNVAANFRRLKGAADSFKVIPNFEKPELARAKRDIELYPVPQAVRPPRPGDADYGIELAASSRR